MPNKKTHTHPWDITRYLDSDEAIAAYLDAALKRMTLLCSPLLWATWLAPKE